MEAEFKNLSSLIELCRDSSQNCLKYVSQDLQASTVGIFVYAEFATNKDMTSQFGFMMVLIDKSFDAIRIHYRSIKSKRLTRSVSASKRFAMVQGFDVCSTMRLSLDGMFEKAVVLNVYTDP